MGEIKFQSLKPGDKVALIAPARAVVPEEMQAFLRWAAEVDLEVVQGEHLYKKHNQFSGTDAQRAEDFLRAWKDPEIRAIFCARGGYGCMRILPYISPEISKKDQNKILIGFSDVTILHLALNNLGYETLHAPMAINFSSLSSVTGNSFGALENVIFGGENIVDLSGNHGLNKRPFHGELIGGNLSLLYASLGTPEQPDAREKILFIEDLDEYLYHVDRMMVAMDRAGMLEHLSGILVGGMTEMKDNQIPFGMTAEDIVVQNCAKYNFPIIFDVPSGHTPENLCLKLNAYTTFDGSKLIQPL